MEGKVEGMELPMIVLSVEIDVVKLVASVGELLELTRVVRLVGTGDSDVNLDISVEPAVM